MADTDQLDRVAFAELAGYSAPGTVTRLLHRARSKRAEHRAAGDLAAAESLSLFPEPDGLLGRTPFWLRSTVEEYLLHRNQLGGGGWLPGPSEGQDEDDDAGSGTCPICERPFLSVSSHRRRRAACSYDPEVRRTAVDSDTRPAVMA